MNLKITREWLIKHAEQDDRSEVSAGAFPIRSPARSASLDQIRALSEVVEVPIQESIRVPSGTSLTMLLRRLKDVGLDNDFVSRRLLPSPIGAEGGGSNSVPLEALELVRRVFGWEPAVLFGSDPLLLDAAASATARFKLPARVNKERLSAYVVYAHYLALLVLEATAHLDPQPIPLDARDFRRAALNDSGSITFESVIRYIWGLGVPILPLNDPGAFHGACWRVKGRNIIVLKQQTSSSARWLHDLLHELWHAAHNPDLEEHPVIEESDLSPTRRQSSDEQTAGHFAGDVVLDGRAEKLAEACVSEARGRVEYLKAAARKVAQREGVPLGALANYLAFRLSLQGINWWGTATNLQDTVDDVQIAPKDVLLAHLNLTALNDIDRGVLMRALEPLVLGISGAMGSGKSLVGKAVAETLGWPCASFGEYVRTFARTQGLDDSNRDVLQDLGELLVETDARQFCRCVLAQLNWKSGEPLVIEGVRHKQVADALRKLVAPMDFRVVYLEVDEETRKARLLARGTTEEEMKRMEDHPTEKQVKTDIPRIADLRLAGTKPLGEMVREIVDWIHEGEETGWKRTVR